MRATLVTGAGGFLGPHVLAAAHGPSDSPVSPGPVVGTCRDPDAAPRFTTPRDAARWVARDLAPEGAALALLQELRPTCVLHCAALSAVAACEADPAAAARLNTALAAEVAAWCAEHDARLVHVSTDLVFGAEAPAPGGFDEARPTAPTSVYGRTKAAAEEAVLAACPAALVVRLPLLYGNSGGRGRGASDSLLEAIERDELPPLFVDEWRTPLEVSNAAEALVELARGEARGILHLAGPERASRHELGLAVLSAMGLAPEAAANLVRAARRAEHSGGEQRAADVSLDARRARSLLATPLLGLEEGTRRAVR